jgi:hypothetical protein
MPSLSLRSLPDDVYEGLRQLAAVNHRSRPEQVRLMIEREVRYSRMSGNKRAREWRARLAGRPFPHLLDDIRADRAR